MPRRALRSYDLTDKQWAALAPPVVTPSPNGGRPTDSDRRAIVNPLRDLHRTGGQWRMRPKDSPPMSAVRSYFAPWNRDEPCITINDTVRKRARQALNRDPEPSIGVLFPIRHNDRSRRRTRRRWGEKRSTGANGNAGLIPMGSCCACSVIRLPFLLPQARRGV